MIKRDTVPTPLLWASRVLSEAVMGFLALVALATAVGPLVFDVSPAMDRLLDSVEWVVLGLFVAEFTVQFTVAKDRSAWVRSPWRLVDAICIGGPLLSLLPQVSDAVRGALVFRFLRVGRAVAFSARAGALAVQKRQESTPALHRGEAKISMTTPGEAHSSTAASWSDLLAWARDKSPAWYHVSAIQRDRLEELVRTAGIRDEDLVLFRSPVGQSRVKNLPGVTGIIVSLPTVAEVGFPAVSKTPVLVMVFETGLLTATWDSFDLQSILPGTAHSALTDASFPARTSYGILALVRDRSAVVAHRHEEEILRLEEIRANQGGPEFLNQAFRLQREMSAARAEVWRLKEIVRKLADGKVQMLGADAMNEPFLDSLLSSTDALHEKFVELKESLTSLIELHMNITSFEMNKFMKLLAIVGFLGLIPSVAGGLLGMNVQGNPWSVTLGQVAFAIAMAMAISLYIFAIKGWLR
jgi:Mg2+ and Co2+ transporter CorA